MKNVANYNVTIYNEQSGVCLCVCVCVCVGVCVCENAGCSMQNATFIFSVIYYPIYSRITPLDSEQWLVFFKIL